MTAADLLYGPTCSALPVGEHAMMLREALDEALDRSTQVEDLERELDEMTERADDLSNALSDLIKACDRSLAAVGNTSPGTSPTVMKIGVLTLLVGDANSSAATRLAVPSDLAGAIRVAQDALARAAIQ